MAQTFKVSKERSQPDVRKHRGRLVVSAISKTPITVSPLEPREGKDSKDSKMNTNNNTKTNTKTKTATTATAKGKESPPVAQAAPQVQPQAQAPSLMHPVSRRGRPPKAGATLESPASVSAPPAPASGSKGKKARGKLTRTRQHRIDHARLLDAEGRSGKVPLAASRIVEQLQALLGRATVEAFRGKRDRPAVTLSKLEEQAIQEALVLFQLKVTLQRGGEVRRAVAS